MNVVLHLIRHEAAGGVILLLATLLAMVFANTGLASLYHDFLSTPVVFRLGPLELDKTLLLVINDGLMALFFLQVGLEVKREFMQGELASPSQVLLPAIAALGGMAVPALIYLFFNLDNPAGINGWAIPAATDIAFALGILALLGKRVPVALKIFLMTVAIFDDLGAIVIIALFYSGQLSTLSLVTALALLGILFLLNRAGVTKLSVYMVIGVLLWLSVLKSGVHATLAGVALAFTIPMEDQRPNAKPASPLLVLEHGLQPWVSFAILPLFVFANAGVSLNGLGLENLMSPITLGIALGLLLGKQLGVFLSSWLLIKSGLARLPSGSRWLEFYGVAILCGIGFTMSLFIGSLAFDGNQSALYEDVKLGVLIGTILSALIGYLLLRFSLSRQPADNDARHAAPALHHS